jgi:hypothetical protein
VFHLTVKLGYPSSSEELKLYPNCLRHMCPRSLSGGKAAGVWCQPSPPSSAEIIERVMLYFYYPSEISCPVLGANYALEYMRTKC